MVLQTASFSSSIPPTAVYRVWPLHMLSIAALRMFLGVSKSGSPTPKLIILTPLRLSALALALIDRVAEGLILPILLDILILRPQVKLFCALLVIHRNEIQTMSRSGQSGLLAVSAPDNAFKIVHRALPLTDLNYRTRQVPDHAPKKAVRLICELQPVGQWALQRCPEHIALCRGCRGPRGHKGGKVIEAANHFQALLHWRQRKGASHVPGVIAQERRRYRTVQYVIFVHLAHGRKTRVERLAHLFGLQRDDVVRKKAV